MKFLNPFLEQHQHRIVGLDIMRSIAIFIVVYEHGRTFFPRRLQRQYEEFNIFQIDGVSIFFVLSGFLIGNILLKMIRDTDFTRKDIFHFWIRRWFRTLPNYFLILFGLLLLELITKGSHGAFDASYLVFVQNFWSPHPNFFLEAWSLTIEEWFYLLFPITCYLFYRFMSNKKKVFLFSALLFIIIPLLLRILKYEQAAESIDLDSDFRKILVFRLDSIMYGILAAFISVHHETLWTKSKQILLWIGLALLILLFVNPGEWSTFYPPLYFNIESITTFCFLPFLSSVKTTRQKGIDALVIFISLISYSMYVLNHSPIIGYFMPRISELLDLLNVAKENRTMINTIVFWLSTIGFSYLLYTYYEHPMTKLRDRFTRKQ